MNETELRKQMIENAKQAGYFKGLLGGLLNSGVNRGDHYYIRSEVFEKVEDEYKKQNEETGTAPCVQRELPCYISLEELRKQFEGMAMSNMFDIERLPTGEYKSTGRNTFILWAGFWECAKNNGIIDHNSDALKMNCW